MKAVKDTLDLLPSVQSRVPGDQAPALEGLCNSLVGLCVGQAGTQTEPVKAGLAVLFDIFQNMEKPTRLDEANQSTWNARIIFTPTGEGLFVVEDFADSGQCLTLNLDVKGYTYLGTWMVLISSDQIKGLAFDIHSSSEGYELGIDDGVQECSFPLGSEMPGFHWTETPRFTGRLEMPGLSTSTDPQKAVARVIQTVTDTVASEQHLAHAQKSVIRSKPVEPGKTTAWYVRYQTADGAEETIQLTESMHIGRSDDNEMIITDPNTSRHHARIIRRGARYWISDMGSSNGTYVNGIRISQSTLLHHSDKFSIGRTTFEVINPVEAARPRLQGTGLKIGKLSAGPVEDLQLPEGEEAEMLEPPQQEVEAGICPRCSAPVRVGAKFCRYCGIKLELPVAAPAVTQDQTPPAGQVRTPGEAKRVQTGLLCPNCGAHLRPEAKICNVCGAVVPPLVSAATALDTAPFASCPKCQKPVQPGVKFCRYCGTQLN